MRAVVIAVAAAVSVLALVRSRRAATEFKKNLKATKRRESVKHAVHQKPGQIGVPKMPKVKRS